MKSRFISTVIGSLSLFVASAASAQDAPDPAATAANLPERVSLEAADLALPPSNADASEQFSQNLRPAPLMADTSNVAVDATPGLDRIRTVIDEDPQAYLIRWQLGRQGAEAMGVEFWF